MSARRKTKMDLKVGIYSATMRLKTKRWQIPTM